MRPKIIFLIWLYLLGSACRPQPPAGERPWNDMIRAGQFRNAAESIHTYLGQHQTTLTPAAQQELQWQLEWMKRVRQDYANHKNDLLKQMQRRIANFQPPEFEQWLNAGKLDYRVIDDDTLFLSSSVSNLFWRYPEIRSRRLPPVDESQYEANFWRYYVETIKAGQNTLNTTILPQRFRVHYTITVDSNAVPAGEIVHCWMPYPRLYPNQTDMVVENSTPPVQWIEPADCPIRSLYFEQPAVAGQKTEFHATYSFTVSALHNQVDLDRILPVNNHDTAVQRYTAPQPPHVMFTPELTRLAHEIVGAETNPYRQTKMVYKWLAKNIQYSYAAEYGTIPNISMFTYERCYGDCGQEALLYITLVRILGIPARWQSGWFIIPGGNTIHDWVEIFLAPYGWIPVEPYLGIYTYQYIETLTTEQKEALNEFYFGNIDHFRLMVNSDHNQPLYPPKQHFRSDPVDFQRGEVEWRGGNIYFDQFSFSAEVIAINP